MKEWKRKTNANSKQSWNNKCRNSNCPDHITNWREGNCQLGINFRGCPIALKSKKYYS